MEARAREERGGLGRRGEGYCREGRAREERGVF